MCRVDKATIVRYYNEGTMPQPYARIAAGPIWVEAQIHAWLAQLEPLGLAELSALLGVHRSTVGRWLQKGLLPAPYTSLRSGQIWLRSQIEAWQPQLFANHPGRWRALPEHAKQTQVRTRRPRVLTDAAAIRQNILLLRNRGLVPAAIADRLRLPDALVAKHLARAARARRFRVDGLTDSEIAQRLQLPPDVLDDYLRGCP